MACMKNIKDRIPSFARRIARPLRDAQKNLLSSLLPEIQIDETFLIPDGFEKTILEIGFGNGEFITANAIQNPQDLYIGCEPYLNGVSALLKNIDDSDIKNIRIYTDDVRNLIPNIKEDSLDIIYVICPDPWPKQKQKKRRLIQAELLKTLSLKLKKEGGLIIATDHLDYAKWILKHIHQSLAFKKVGEVLEDFTSIPRNWIYTKYQRRGLDNSSKIYYFSLKRR